MNYKLAKLNAVLMLGLSMATLEGQTIMNVKNTSGTKTPYTLSSIRKLTFPSTGNMTVTKTSSVTDNYALNNVRNLNFGVVSTSIEASADVPKANLHLYPNPVLDVLNIRQSVAQIKGASVEVLSIDGRILISLPIGSYSADYQINVSALNPGVYICRLNNGANTETTKFVKQ